MRRDPGGPEATTGVLRIGKQEGLKERRGPLALKLAHGAMSQDMQAAARWIPA